MYLFTKFFKILSLFLVVATVCPAQDNGAAFFDPEKDPIMVTANGKVRFAVSEEVLVRAADIRFEKLGEIETIYKKEIDAFWYIFIECRLKSDLQESAIVAVKLRRDEHGSYYADHSWNACIGRSCGSCGWESDMDGCFCKTDKPGEPGTPGFCYNIWSDDPLFMKTPLKQP